MSVVSEKLISEQDYEFFQENGYVVLRGFLDAEQTRLVREAYDVRVGMEIDADPSREGAMIQTSGMGTTFKGWHDSSYIHKLEAVARELQGESGVKFWYDQVIMKPAGNSGSTLWHQDAGYWGGKSQKGITAWLALSEVGEHHGCMQFIPGSHKRGIVEHVSASERSAIKNAQEAVGVDESLAVKVMMQPGDVSLHDEFTLHYTTGNNADSARCGLVTHMANGIEPQYGQSEYYLTRKSVPATPSAITKLPDELRAQQIQDMKWGMFICWSFSTFSGQEWTPTRDKDAGYFKATDCDTDQWCETAKAAGMKYILFLTKHHDGFCLWDTKTTEKKVTNSPLGIDVLAKLRKSCDKYGLKLALYFSEGDWTWPGAVDGKGLHHGVDMGIHPEMKKAQLKELLTQYGPIEFWWMDHAAGTGGLSHAETVEWVHKFQPNSFVGFNSGKPAGRLNLRERGKPGPIEDKSTTKDNKDAEADYKGYLVAEFTYPILPDEAKGGADWFYSLPKYDSLSHPASKLYKDYIGAVKYGNIFSINVGPNYEGKLREIDVKTLREVGQKIREA